MKKFLLVLSFLFVLFIPITVFAALEDGGGSGGTVQATNPIDAVFGQINPPKEIGNLGVGSAGINNLLGKIIQLIYAVAGVIFVFMVIISAVQWILSGGDKEAVGKARGRLTWAVIGIVFLALAWVIISVIGQVTGFTFFKGQ